MAGWADRQARRIRKACHLLAPGVPSRGGVWADLGCGDGIFTAALFLLLEPDAEIHAVDADARKIAALKRNFRESFPQARLEPRVADFTRRLRIPDLDGIVMANALHFQPDPLGILRHLSSFLQPLGRLIIVEYNTHAGNWAVPHPVSDEGFLDLARQAGYIDPQIQARVSSSFLGQMYAGLAFRPGEGQAMH